MPRRVVQVYTDKLISVRVHKQLSSWIEEKNTQPSQKKYGIRFEVLPWTTSWEMILHTDFIERSLPTAAHFFFLLIKQITRAKCLLHFHFLSTPILIPPSCLPSRRSCGATDVSSTSPSSPNFLSGLSRLRQWFATASLTTAERSSYATE